LHLFPLIADSIVSNQSQREVQFEYVVRTGKECQIMIDNLGYTFCNALPTKFGNVRWRCSKKQSKKCRAYALTNNHLLIKEGHEHNHPPG
jgi:hypothetical protein